MTPSSTPGGELPPLPDAKETYITDPQDVGPILPVPRGIRPTLSKYRYVQLSI